MNFLINTECRQLYVDKRMADNTYHRMIVHVCRVELLNSLCGMHHLECKDQLFIDGCAKTALVTKLCYGREVNITEENSVLENYTWVTCTVIYICKSAFKIISHHSGYTTNIKNNVCTHCIKDIG